MNQTLIDACEKYIEEKEDFSNLDLFCAGYQLGVKAVAEPQTQGEESQRNSIVVWNNGMYKRVIGSTWEYEHDENWLTTIPANPVASNTGMRWVKASEVSVDLERHYIGKWAKEFVNSGMFNDEGYFIPDSREYRLIHKDESELFILVKDEPPSSPSASGKELAKEVESDLHKLSDKIVSHWWNEQQPFEETLVLTQIRYRKEISKLLAGFAAGKGEGDAVEFLNWVAGNNYHQMNGCITFRQGEAAATDFYTPSELYALFIKSKNTIK